jgi:hypothetical protein
MLSENWGFHGGDYEDYEDREVGGSERHYGWGGTDGDSFTFYM